MEVINERNISKMIQHTFSYINGKMEWEQNNTVPINIKNKAKSFVTFFEKIKPNTKENRYHMYSQKNWRL